MKRFIIKKIDIYTSSLEFLTGFSIDEPTVNKCYNWPFINIAGWVVGKNRLITEVEVTLETLYLPLQTTSVGVPRPDVAKFLSNIPESKNSGFFSRFSVVGLPPRFEILVNAIDVDREVIPMATIQVEAEGEAGNDSQEVSRYLQPILLSALARSGTTWLMRLLISHPAIVGYPRYPYELHVAGYAWHACRVLAAPSGLTGLSHPDLFWFDLQRISSNPFFSPHLDDLTDWFKDEYIKQILSCHQFAIESFYRHLSLKNFKRDALFFAEKQVVPYYSWLAWDLYPRTREIFLVRDWRDVFCSILAFNNKRGIVTFGRETVNSDIDFAHRLKKGISNIYKQYSMRSNKTLLVRYEDLIFKPYEELKRIFEYIGVDSESVVVNTVIEQANRPDPLLQQHRTSHSEQESVGRWKRDLSPELQEAINAIFQEHLQAFGYA
jgi:hypothetical protein